MRQLHKEDIPQFFDWLKSVLALSSAGIGSIAFSAKPDAFIQLSFKWAVALFSISALLTLFSMIVMITHKRSKNDYLPGWKAALVILSFIAFLGGIGSVVLHVMR